MFRGDFAVQHLVADWLAVFMSHVLQRCGVRFVANNKAGHTALVSAFMTPPGADHVVGPRPLADETLRGGSTDAVKDWPVPVVNVCFFRHPLKRLYSVWNHLTQRTHYGPFRPHMQKGIGWVPFVDLITIMIEKEQRLDPHIDSQFALFERVAHPDAQNLFFRLEDSTECWPKMVDYYDLDCTRTPKILNTNEYDQPFLPWGEAYEKVPVGSRACLHKFYADDLRIWHKVAQTP